MWDAIQETMLKAYKSLHTLKEPAYFKTWIFRILINECNTILKKRPRAVTLQDIPQACSDTSEYDLIDLRDAVDQKKSYPLVIVDGGRDSFFYIC